MSWGKHFASMYEGSMRGKGSPFFAVWGYVISHMTPNRSHGTTVELNPGIIAFLIGEKESVVVAQIKEMCGPDPKSRTSDKGGRKLIQISEYTHEVVNGNYYRKIRNEEERREYQRMKQTEYRQTKKKNKGGHPDGGAAAIAHAEDRDPVAVAEREALNEEADRL